MITIPIISSILFHWGGKDQFPWLPWFNQKLWRWLMGIPIAYWYGWQLRSVYPMLCIATYFIATNVISYGENHILRKLLGRDGCWAFYGFMFGLASFPILGYWCIAQGAFNAILFMTLMQLSNDGWVISKPKIFSKIFFVFL